MLNAMILPKTLSCAAVEDDVNDEPRELSVDSLNRGEREEAENMVNEMTE